MNSEQQNKEYGKYSRGALLDINNDGQDELLYMYDYGASVNYSIWTFKDGKPILLVNEELCILAGAGRGSLSFVEYDGKKYLCRMYYNAEVGSKGTLNYYVYDLLSPVIKNDALSVVQEYSFEFRYYSANDEINTVAFSFLKNGVPISIDEFESVYDVLSDQDEIIFDVFISDTGGDTLDALLEKLSDQS